MSEILYPERPMSGPELEPAVKYTLPFRWGTYRVSEEAHHAYNFTPLMEGVVEGSSDEMKPSEMEPALRMDVWLLSPEEIRAQDSTAEDVSADLHIISSHRIHPEGVSILQGLNKDRQQTEEIQMENMEKVAEEFREMLEGEGFADEISIEDIVNQDGLTLAEAVEQSITQQMMEILCDNLKSTLKRSISVWMERDLNREFMGNLKRMGKNALLGSGVILGSGTAISMESPTIADNIVVAGMTLGYLAFSFKDIGKDVQEYLNLRTMIRPEMDGMAERASIQASGDVFKAYSTAYFDEQIGSKLDDFDDFSSEED